MLLSGEPEAEDYKSDQEVDTGVDVGNDVLGASKEELDLLGRMKNLYHMDTNIIEEEYLAEDIGGGDEDEEFEKDLQSYDPRTFMEHLIDVLWIDDNLIK